MKSISLEILFESLIQEGRTKSVIDKWSNHVIPGYEDRGPMKNEDDWNWVIETVQSPNNDPSGNGKYIDWVLARLVDYRKRTLDSSDGDIPDLSSELEGLLDIIESFHRFSERNLIQNKDIYSPDYKDLTRINAVIRQAATKAQELTKERELKAGADKIYQDSRWLVMVPKTHEASCHYGAGTKWCTTMKNTPSHFDTYTTNGVLFYLLDKTRKSGSLYKLAFHQSYGPGATLSEVDKATGIRFNYRTIVPLKGTLNGFDEEDRPINVNHVIPLLPEGLVEAMESYYKTNVERINHRKKEEARKTITNEMIVKQRQQELSRKRKIELDDALLTTLKEDNWIFNYVEGAWEGNFVSDTRFVNVYGNWEYMPMDNGHRFQIYHAGDYPNKRVESQSNYFIDGHLILDEHLLATIRLYKSPEDGPFGDVDVAEAVNVNLPININRLFEYRNFWSEFRLAIESVNGGRDFNEILINTPEDRWNPRQMVKTTLTQRNNPLEDFPEFIVDQIQKVIESELHNYFYNSGMPNKDGSVLWSPSNSHSSYKFEYPAHQNSMTGKFLNYVTENPGRTAEQFYQDVLGHRRPAGHNSMFFGSIKDAGLVRMERRGRQFVYFIGPNYEAWTQGRLKRV
jgi:hypothetical protein